MTQGRERRDSTRWFIAGYATLAGFFALEAATRERGTASSLAATADDQDTTRDIVLAYAVGAVAAPFLRLIPFPRLPYLAGPIGLVVEASGLGLRAWSMRTLGHNYSRTLRAESEQLVVETGPYAVVRHPGYLGSIMTWFGFALTSRSLPVAALVGSLVGNAYRRRIDAEEQLLSRDLPAYAGCKARTKRLIPYIW
jgi:protein-S-isoprenylcysteine O-methyltransferase Ste14